MTNMQTITARIGKHVERIKLGAGRHLGSRKSLIFLPVSLPFWFDFGRIVAWHRNKSPEV